MKTSFYLFIIMFLILGLSACEDDSIIETEDPISEEIDTDLLVNKTRKLTQFFIANEQGLESDLTFNYQDCDFETTYVYNSDSTQTIIHGCSGSESTNEWIFSNDKSKILICRYSDTLEYLILVCNNDLLKLELLTDDLPDYRTYYVYE